MIFSSVTDMRCERVKCSVVTRNLWRYIWDKTYLKNANGENVIPFDKWQFDGVKCNSNNQMVKM